MASVVGRSRVAGRRSWTEVVGRRGEVVVAGARWCQSPRFSASLIGLRLEFVVALWAQ
jgi:hypothetical protein